MAINPLKLFQRGYFMTFFIIIFVRKSIKLDGAVSYTKIVIERHSPPPLFLEGRGVKVIDFSENIVKVGVLYRNSAQNFERIQKNSSSCFIT